MSVGCIVNNTGIPASQWSRYKPAGVNPDGPSVDFSDLLSGRNQEIVDKLTDDSKKVLQRLKANPNSISKREWMDLTHELNAMGAISDLDYGWSRVDLHLVPLVTDREGNVAPTYPMIEKLLNKGYSSDSWPQNPLEHLDQWAFSLNKWGAELSRERNLDGTPKYPGLSPIYDQAAACGRVSNLIKGLLTADLFSSKGR